MSSNRTLLGVAALAVPLTFSTVRPVLGYDIFVDLNTYTKDREGGSDPVTGAVAQTLSLTGADGVWLITDNSYGENNPSSSGISTNGSGFTLTDWRQIITNIAGSNALISSEDNPTGGAHPDNQSFKDAGKIIGSGSATGFSFVDALNYIETGIDPAGGTVLSDAQISTFAAKYNGGVNVLTRSYVDGGTNGNWKTETDRALSNPLVSAVTMETTDIAGQNVVGFVNAAAAANKRAYIYLGTQNAARNIPGIYLLKQQAAAAMASGDVRFVVNNNYDVSNAGNNGYSFYGSGDTVQGTIAQVNALKLAVPVESWNWKTAGSANWSTKSNWTVGPVAHPLTAAGATETSPSQMYDSANFTSSTLTGGVNVNIDVASAKVLAVYFDNAANYTIAGPQTLTLTSYGTVGSDGRVGFTAGAIPIAAADASNSYGSNIIPISVKGTGTNTISAAVTLDATNAVSLTIDQQNTSHIFTMSGKLTTAGLPITVQGSGDTTLSGQITGGTTLTKTGAGTLRLLNTQSYNGTTTVQNGTMLVNGSLSGSAVAVNASGSFGGTGTLGGLVTSNGTLTPGDGGTGKLTLAGGLSLGSGSTLSFDLGTSKDLISTNSLTLGSNVNLNVARLGGFGAGTYSLIDYSTLINGGLLSSWTATGLSSAYSYRFALGTDSANGNASSVQLIVSAVPEPSILSVLAISITTLATRKRQNRQISGL